MKNETNVTKGSLFQPEAAPGRSIIEIPRSLFQLNSFIILHSVLCLLDMNKGGESLDLSRLFIDVSPSPRTGNSSFSGLFIPVLSRF